MDLNNNIDQGKHTQNNPTVRAATGFCIIHDLHFGCMTNNSSPKVKKINQKYRSE